MNNTKNEFKKIREGLKAKFIVGIIGATSPDYGYSPDMGFVVGNQVRAFLDTDKTREKFGDNSMVFTGGVEGVGVDAYMGVITHSKDSRFFALIPEMIYVPIEEDEDVFIINIGGEKKMRSSKYYLPISYKNIAKLAGTECREVIGGRDMSERRAYVAGIADVLVMVNGSAGTLDEAVNALDMGVPVIVVGNSGGKTDVLKLRKEGVRQVSAMMPPQFYHKHDADSINKFLQKKGMNNDLIIIAEDEWDVQNKLGELLNK